MKILIIRHAESNGNAASGDYSVADADALSPKGLEQAEELAKSLETWQIDKVIVSPKQRALQTIAPYLAKTGRKAELWPEVVEACWHEERETPADTWESKPAELPKDIAQYFAFRDGSAIQPSQDSFSTGFRRVYDTVERIEKSFCQTEKTILMVSHGFFIREMLNLMLKLPEFEEFHHDNCGMTLLSFDKKWVMEFCNRKIIKTEVSRLIRM